MPCYSACGEAGYIALVARSVDAKDLVVRYNAYEALMEALLPLAQKQVSTACEHDNCPNPFSCECKQILKARAAYKNAMDSASVADVHEVMDRMRTSMTKKGYERCPSCGRWGIHTGRGGLCSCCEHDLPGCGDEIHGGEEINE